MADDIGYSRNNWSKGDVLTAQKLNANEIALETVINRVNGKNSEGTLTSDKTLATQSYVNDRINEFTTTNNKGATNKTMTGIDITDNKIKITYSNIVLANGERKGLVTAGTNLSASNGTISLIASPTISENLTVNGTSNLIGKTTIGTVGTINNTNDVLQVYGKTNIMGETIITSSTNQNLTIGNRITEINEYGIEVLSRYNYNTIFNTNCNTINSTSTLFNGASVVIGTDIETNGNHTYNGTLTINSATEFKQPLTNLTIGTDEYVGGTHHYTGSLIINATTEFKNETNFNGALTKFNGTNITIGTNNNSIYGGTLNVNAATTFYNTTTFANEVNFNNATTFNNTTTFNNNATFNNDLNFTNLKLISQTINYKNINQENPSDHTITSAEILDNTTKSYIKNINIDGQQNGIFRVLYSYSLQDDTLTIGEVLGNVGNLSANVLHLRGNNITLSTKRETEEDNNSYSIYLSTDEITWDDITMTKQNFQALLALVSGGE